MLRINTKIWSHESIKTQQKYFLREILLSKPLKIDSFQELVKAVAEISFHNPEQVLFFRGQDREYWKNTSDGRINSFYPSIYRSKGSSLSSVELEERYKTLEFYSEKLLQKFKDNHIQGHEKIAKFREISWAILQHYEVCQTPFLDVTHSLRVAASFALNNTESDGHLYIFGFPHPNGSITYSIEHEIVNIRLLSICPPDAHRPYFQEGFLVGTFPFNKSKKHPSLDIGVRLIAKFKLSKKNFWDKNFHSIPNEALYPENDSINKICLELKSEVQNMSNLSKLFIGQSQL